MTEHTEDTKRYILSVLVGDVPGILARIVSLFTGRGFNIDSLTVGHATTSDGELGGIALSRMTIVTSANSMPIDHIVAQIRKLVDVLDVQNLGEKTYVEADITLVKVHVSSPLEQAAALTVATTSFRATSMITRDDYLIFRFPGREDASKAFIDAMRRFGEVDSVYSGTIALA
ncbi:acetolactate synthase small subunit [Candidatus Kaiserbacteria bacterium]|nr:acetolactate synthase small subunit [Candidatus Kaiserbacteria bacterium]